MVNILGGCCGSTPAHIKAIADAIAGLPPRQLPDIKPECRLSGLEAFNIGDDSLFVNVGERANITGSAKFKRLILNEEFEEALDICRTQDRKSTRLNSSHVVISYAVFCLKKKKQTDSIIYALLLFSLTHDEC